MQDLIDPLPGFFRIVTRGYRQVWRTWLRLRGVHHWPFDKNGYPDRFTRDLILACRRTRQWRTCTTLIAGAWLILQATASMAIVVGESLDDPEAGSGGADGWSGIYVLNGYDPIPRELVTSSFNFWAQANRLDGNHVVQPLIIRAPNAEPGTGTIWHVGPAIPDSEMSKGPNSVPFNSPPIPNDGHLYLPAVWQWRSDGANDNAAAVIPFGSAGQGMYATNRNENDWGDLEEGIDDTFLGETMENGHASGPGGRRYWFNFETSLCSLARCHPGGDLNGDGVINELDFHVLAGNLGAHLDRDVSHSGRRYQLRRPDRP